MIRQAAWLIHEFGVNVMNASSIVTISTVNHANILAAGKITNTILLNALGGGHPFKRPMIHVSTLQHVGRVSPGYRGQVIMPA